MLTKDQRTQAIKFQDAIGEVVDAYLKDGMHPHTIENVLMDEARQAHGRKLDLEAEEKQS